MTHKYKTFEIKINVLKIITGMSRKAKLLESCWQLNDFVPCCDTIQLFLKIQLNTWIIIHVKQFFKLRRRVSIDI